MSATSFNEMEFDAIGEIMNISLGSSATAVSTLLGTKVNITTPIVQVLTKDDFDFQDLEPAVGVEISYVKGLSGKSVMLFSRNDVRVIVSMMMGAEIPEEEFVMDEINASAIREAMNQMMGASATALSEFLGTTVDISTPISYEIDDGNAFKDKYFDGSEDSVVIRFTLEIEGKLSSEFINIMSVDLVKRLLEPFKAQFGIEDDDDEYIPSEEPEAPVEAPQAEVQEAAPAEAPAEAPQAAKSGPIDQAQADALLASLLQAQAEESSAEAAQPASSDNAAPAENQPPKQEAQATPAQPMPEAAPTQPIPQAAPAPQAIPQGMVMGGMMDPMTMQLITQMQQSQTQMMELMREMQSGRSSKAAPAEPSIIKPLNSKEFLDDAEGKEENASNRELLMKVPLEISVEIGRTRKLVKDILEFTQGSLVVLDKMAGEQADLYVNGECIAKGDIVVVEDNFGIRITEILKKDINEESL